MTFLFYRREATTRLHPSRNGIRIWRPGSDRFPPRGPFRTRNALWWGADRLGLFSNGDFMEIAIWDGRWLLHRSILTPRWYRFPFMAPEDLQIGDVWTEPRARGQGLAGQAIAEALAQAGNGQRVWYVVEANNRPSVRLIEKCGFSCVGEGMRTSPFGLRIAGRFHLRRMG